MSNFITKNRYEGLDPEIAELLKQGKIVKVEAWDENQNNSEIGYLIDYNSQSSYSFVISLMNGAKHIRKNIEPILQEKTDWSKVPVDTLCEVSYSEDFPGLHTRKRYFSEQDEGKLYFWLEGRTSKTETSADVWYFARIIEE